MKKPFHRPGVAILAVLSALAASCECDDVVSCPPFDTASVAFRFATRGDSITFRDPAGDRLAFIVRSVELNQAYQETDHRTGFGGCELPDCRLEASQFATADSFVGRPARYSVHLGKSEYYFGGPYADLDFLDLHYSFLVTSVGKRDSIVVGLTLGNRTYDTLTVITRDTTGTALKNLRNPRTFLHNEDGVVGFEDRQTGLLFYRD